MGSFDSSFNSIIYNIALGLPGMLLAIVAHEYAHGRVAFHYGDPTAKLAGRLSFNPVVHLDLFGSVIVPLIGAIIGGIMFGWAKPVPIDYRHFKLQGNKLRMAFFWVSFAGPLANFTLVIISSFLLVLLAKKFDPSIYFYEPLIKILNQAVLINTIFGAFNLLPIPPLDGSKMISAFLSYQNQIKFDQLGNYGFFILLIIIATGVTQYLFMPFLFAAQKIMELFYTIL